MNLRPAEMTDAADREIVIVRVFAAPRGLVFKAWTDPELLTHWFAPNGCSLSRCTIDLRIGGIWHYCMHLADGRDIWGIGVFREIVIPERIVYTDSFADQDGNRVPPTHYGISPSHPAETLVTVTFADQDSQTTLTLRHAISMSVKERDETQQGWSQMMDRLGDLLVSLKGRQ